MSKVVSVEEAVSQVRSGDSIAVCGTGVVLEPDLLLEELERRFLSDGTPADLSIVAPMCVGDQAGIGGMNRFAHRGMLRKLTTSSVNASRHPELIRMLDEGACEGYVIGMGTMIQLFTATGTGRSHVDTVAGLETYLDPRVEGGAMNAVSTDPPVRLIERDGEEMLSYPAFELDVAFIRATTADENGYLTLEEETNTLGVLDIALATKARGGIVIAQVKRIAASGSLDPRMVRVPGTLVDFVVHHPRQSQLGRTMQGPEDSWNPAFVGAVRSPLTEVQPVARTADRALLRRAALEMPKDGVAALGAGTPTHLPRIFHEEGATDEVVFTNEHGIHGGLMATAIGGSFVPALNPLAIMDSTFQFNFYESGLLDVAYLGAGEIDRFGNVNVSRFGPIWTATGGFCSITAKTPSIVFCGTLRSGRLQAEARDGKLTIVQEGLRPRFVSDVQQLTFPAARAVRRGQRVTYVTERCVFSLTEEGPVLTEIAPGIDLQRDVLDQVEFPVVVSSDLREMDAALFLSEPFGLAGRLSPKNAGGAR